MIEQYPVTPPPELVAQIRSDALRKSSDVLDYELRMIHAAYHAGADQELEACCEWLNDYMGRLEADDLREARRPGAPSLKEQALEVLERSCFVNQEDETTIRRALEQLDD